MEPLALTISQAAKLGGPCRSILYEDIRTGRLRAVKRGRSTRILLEDFKKYLCLCRPYRRAARKQPARRFEGKLATVPNNVPSNDRQERRVRRFQQQRDFEAHG